MSKIFVIAGTHEQFNTFRQQLMKAMSADHTWIRIHDIVYISGPDTLRGHRDPWGYKVGTWESRVDIKEIILQIALAGSSYKENFIEVEL